MTFTNIFRYVLVPLAMVAGFLAFYMYANAESLVIGGGTPKECTFTIDHNQIKSGESVTITWHTTGYDIVTVDGQKVSASDSKTYTNVQFSTVYKLRAQTYDGQHTCNQQVDVTCVPPELACTLGASPKKITEGESSVLTWTTDNADSISIDQGIGSVSADGNKSVSPTVTTKYTLTAERGSESVQCPVTIEVEPKVIPDPECMLNAAPLSIKKGESSVLTWTTDNADSISIDQGIGSVSADGNKSVSPTVTTKYTLTATGNNKTVTCPVTVTVTEDPDPKEPSCPLVATGDIKVVEFGNVKLLSSAGAARAETAVKPLALDAGKYKVTLVSWDGYTARINADQPHEQWELSFLNNGTQVAVSNESSDLADLVYEAMNNEVVNGALVINSNVTHVQGLHAYYPDTSSPNSLVPICASVERIPEEAPACTIVADPTAIKNGEASTLTWTSTNAVTAIIDKAIGSVALNDNMSVSPIETTTYTLTVANADGVTAQCPATITVTEPDAPVCEAFTVSPNLFTNGTGGDVTLDWIVLNADTVSIDQGIGAVGLTGTTVASVSDTTTFTLTAIGGGKTVTCPATVTVTESPKDPICQAFTATPDSFTNGTGGDVTLDWTVLNADTVSIDQGIGAVALVDTKVVNATDTTTYTLTAIGNGKTVQCPATVTVTEPESELSCDSFTDSPDPVSKGSKVTLKWATTDAVKVSIDNGVGDVAVDGSTEVTVTADLLYTLTATDKDGKTVTCKTDVNVSGGGGGSSAPRCNLDISDTKIKRGEEVTITWDNTRTNDMVLEDNRGNVLIDTEKTTKYDEDEGSITVKPTKDTEYTMTVYRGSRDRICKVKVEVEDDEVTVISSRTQTPQVAGIALSQVPYTGFEAGPFLTFIFYTVLALWAAFVAYIMIVREKPMFGMNLGGAAKATPAEWEAMVDELPTEINPREEKIRAAAVASTTAVAPTNLPTGLPVAQPVATVGYQKAVEAGLVAELENTPFTRIENLAHDNNTLLSSDTIQFFMEAYENEAERLEALATMIGTAKAKFPSEGGWLVLNRARVNELQTIMQTPIAKTPRFIPETRVGASSLAEAIVTGNVKAAIDMIGTRPMFSLADAVADLDGVYRARKGVAANASDLLVDATRALSDEQMEAMIAALTSALDGAYTDETAAVKMAIMKASQMVR